MSTASLSSGEVQRVAERLAALTDHALPLASGLRAAALETPQRRVRAALNRLAEDLERGRLLTPESLQHLQTLPHSLRTLIGAALEQGGAGPMLSQYIQQQSNYGELSRSIWRVMAYPTLLLLACVVVLLAFCAGVGSQFGELYDEFGLTLPAATQFLLWWSRNMAPPLLKALPVLLAGLLLFRLTLPRVQWHRLRRTFPLMGPLHVWLGVMQWSRLLRLLIEYRVRLPEALQLTADSAADAAVGRSTREVAERVAAGQPLAEALETRGAFPATLVPVIRWGERGNDLAGALESAAQYYEDRFRARRFLLSWLLPPVMFVLIAIAIVGAMMVALWLPLFDLISKLS